MKMHPQPKKKWTKEKIQKGIQAEGDWKQEHNEAH